MTHPAARRLFIAGDLDAHALAAEDVPALQAFIDANPEYYLMVSGSRPRADEALREFEERPPPEIPFDEVYVIGFLDETGRMAGMASVLTNLPAPGVWHVGLFIVATSLHGTGLAPVLYQGLETWAIAGGATWMRLGVVAGNARAERFWRTAGYHEVRRRNGMQYGSRMQDVRVLVKPLGSASIDDYLSRVARDRPES